MKTKPKKEHRAFQALSKRLAPNAISEIASKERAIKIEPAVLALFDDWVNSFDQVVCITHIKIAKLIDRLFLKPHNLNLTKTVTA